MTAGNKPDSVEYEPFETAQKRVQAQNDPLRDAGRLFSVSMSQMLSAADEIHTAMALFDSGHAAQANLNKAMHSVLIAAEQCRQAHAAGIR